ncbi:Ent-kaurenoic acid oxidase 2 [Acorus calamus]|uniref:Ent-kaurenoic acid oxidase 2 n=1 Tax=Acorus calamus TaxID=4465 RepID=A0AAV9CBJ7_ACOCL|nr:Ent-kaurenoic acid oxidase 2 [Acorus calamus]
MDLGSLTVAIVVGVLGALYWVLKRVNEWVYESKLGEERRSRLPPGDMGWPLIGNMWSFLRAFKSGRPDSFISSYVKRFNRTGVYKSFMFGSPTIMVTYPEGCKQVLMDDEHFIPGWPKATLKLVGRKSFVGLSHEEHKWIRKLTAAPINGHDALCVYLKFIEEMVVSSLDKLSNAGEIEFLTELRRLTFRIIMHIFMSTASDGIMEELERVYTNLNYGMRAMAINLPGFVYHRALKDENGRSLTDEEVIDVLIMYLNAGHESSGHITMWTTVLLQEHPEFLEKAKAEQEEIVRNRPPGQKGLTLKEVRQMEYLSKVIDETLRVVNISFVVFREATSDVNVNGYLIPKGWRVQVWFRNVHMDSEVHSNPTEFNPSRWEGPPPKAGTFIPFGGGSRLCPGNDLAKLEIGIFMHYFLPWL